MALKIKMANNINQIISYVPDFSSVQSGFKDLARLNTALSNQLQKDLGSAFDIKNLKIDKITQEFDKFGNATGQIGRLSAVAQDASGKFQTFSRSFAVVADAASASGFKFQIFNDNLKAGATGLGLISKQAGEVVQPISNINNHFNSLNAINEKLTNTLGSKFGPALKVVEKNINSINQKPLKFEGKDFIVPVQKLGAVVQTADGQ